jgi:hypothetical protein
MIIGALTTDRVAIDFNHIQKLSDFTSLSSRDNHNDIQILSSNGDA